MPKKRLVTDNPPVLTTLPSSPVDGQQVLYRNGSTGVRQLVYDANIGWVDTPTRSAGLIWPLAGNANNTDRGFTVPNYGVYVIIAHATGYRTSGGLGATYWYVDNVFMDQSILYFNQASVHMALMVCMFQITLAAGYHVMQPRTAAGLSVDANDYINVSYMQVS